MALVEPVFVGFILVALLIADYAAESRSFPYALAAGAVLSLGILTKLTAVFAIVPLLVILAIRTRSWPAFARLSLPALGAAVLLPAMQHLFLIPHYLQDHLLYMQLNIRERQVTGLLKWFHALYHIAAGLRAAGPLLLCACLLGTVWLCFPSNRWRADPLLQLGLLWLASNLAILSTVAYFPSRYCLSLLFPLALLAARYTVLAAPYNRTLGASLCTLLGLTLLISTTRSLTYMLHPHYSMADLAAYVLHDLPQGAHGPCLLMGDMANTITLYNALPSVSSRWSTVPLAQRIATCTPSIFLSTGPVSHDNLDQFLTSQHSLTLQTTLPVMQNYSTGQPVSIYKVNSTPPPHYLPAK
jgi:4-amino-4-deoxy-L-arabinose transferase-like glycosyltransferase